MIELSLAEIAEATGGRVVGDPRLRITAGVHTDSREVTGGSLFFALPGETTDGHLFAPAAREAGAVAAVVERELDEPLAQVVVPEGLAALSALAAHVVARVRALGELRVVAVTGSNGKTTTKNMLRTVLEAEGATVAPPGSFNNEVGAPISMLRIDEGTRFLVVEMGADAVGDVAKLMAVARPDVGIVLKVGLAHIGKFGDPEAIARAKSEMVSELGPDGVAVLNADEPRVAAMAQRAPGRVVRFGLDPEAHVRGSEVAVTASGTGFTLHADGASHPVRLGILGEHHAMNALATVAAVRELGIPVPRAIERLEAMPRAERWRMERLERPDGVLVINDAYNASPDSMAAALKTLAGITRGTGRRSIAVLGEMAELGDWADDEHDRIGRLAVRLNISQLVVVGHAARHIHNAAGLEGSWDGESILVQTPDEAYDVLRDRLQEGDVVLVKSSKSAELRFLGDRLAGVAE